jgi:cell division protein FtsI/penicillin-binding protein 2
MTSKHPHHKKKSSWLPSFGLLFVLLWGITLIHFIYDPTPVTTHQSSGITKERIAAALEEGLDKNEFPNEVTINLGDSTQTATVEYALNNSMQHKMEKMIRSYRPDYAAFVALDVLTGKILTLVSYQTAGEKLGNLSLSAIFPAASVFKIVTAAAALDQNKIQPETPIPFTGAYHTLYRRNVNQMETNRWSHWMTLKEAFAKSVNTVFAKIGVMLLDPTQMRTYANKFFFDTKIIADVPVESGEFNLPESDDWAVAEAASGYNRFSLMSPLQGALMAASVVNDGKVMEPYIVSTLKDPEGATIYEVEKKPFAVTMSPDAARALRSLMEETVTVGTSRQTFRTLLKKSPFNTMEIGGKTGSLMSKSPRGKCDWFVGYASHGPDRIAFAALTVNVDTWKVKSSYLARSFVEEYFTHEH